MTDVGADREAYWQGTHTRVQEARQELVCPICIETLTEPRTLTCQHTFCTTCLQQLALSGLSRSAVKASSCTASSPHCGGGWTGQEITISCPECRVNVILPENGVQGLPKNFKLERFIEILSPVEREELARESAHKQTQHCCVIHKKKVTDYYCTHCRSLACGDCLLERHLNHDVRRATEVLPQHAAQLKELIPAANEALRSGEASLSALLTQAESLRVQGVENTRNIEVYFRKLHDILTKRETELKYEVQEQVEKGRRQIEMSSLAVKKSVLDIRQTTQDLEQLTQSESLELLRREKKLKNQLRLNQEAVKTSCNDASKLESLSIKILPLEDARLEVICRTIAAKAPIPLPRKQKEPPSSSPPSSDTKDHFLGLNSKDADYALTPDTIGRCEEVKESEYVTASDLQLPSPPMRFESYHITTDIIEPELIWGPKELSSSFFHSATGSVYPRGVCCGVSGTVIITDVQNHCVRILASTGKCLDVVGKEGKSDGMFGEPTSVTTDHVGNLLVCDLCPARLQKFSPEGKFITKLYRRLHSNPLGEPWGIAVNHDGKIFVSDWDRSCIHIYSEAGRYVSNFGSTGNDAPLKYPAGIAIDKRGRIIVADRGNHVVCIYTPEGNLLTRFGKMGRAPGELYFPFGVAVSTDSSSIYISESGNHRISVFDSHGKFLRCFGKKGSNPGTFHLPRHICIDKQGRLLVSDEQNQRIQIFTSY